MKLALLLPDVSPSAAEKRGVSHLKGNDRMHRSPSKLRRIVAPALALALIASLAPAASAEPADKPATTSDRLIVGMKSGVSSAGRSAVAAKVRGVRRGRIADLGSEVVQLPAGASLKAAMSKLKADSRVSYVEPDYRVQAFATPNDTYYSRQWALPAVSAPSGWDISTGSTTTVVAVVDTGVYPHSDLSGHLVAGYDFVNSDSSPLDDEGHGTAVAGVIAATGNNSMGIAGVNWKTKIMPLKALDSSGSGYTSDIAKGVTYAADHGAKVINMSLGGSQYSSTFKSAIDYAYSKGVVIVAAAGNENTSANSYPAAYPNVLGVSALSSSTTRAAFSNYGAYVDVAAPGQQVYSLTNTGGYAYWDGTSFSSPMVAGLAGLIVGRNSTLSAAAVSQIVTSTASDIGDAGRDNYFGWGRMNVYNALKATPAATIVNTVDQTAPTVSLTSPTNGRTVAGVVPLGASASDDRAVVKVVFSVDGRAYVTDTTAPYASSWYTAATYNGWHYVRATAYDAAGNSSSTPLAWVYTLNSW